jgi:hypothetical protein
MMRKTLLLTLSEQSHVSISAPVSIQRTKVSILCHTRYPTYLYRANVSKLGSQQGGYV